MFEVEYLWNGWIKKDGVDANLIQYCPYLSYQIDFAFSPRLTTSLGRLKYCTWLKHRKRLVKVVRKIVIVLKLQ